MASIYDKITTIRYIAHSNGDDDMNANDMNDLDLLIKLSLNNNLSKSEMNVVFFTWKKQRTSAEVTSYLRWAAPNVARLLLSMTNKGLLTRVLESDKKSYLYLANRNSKLITQNMND